MNNWLQNIKGQLTELATEVLHEATEEGQVSTSSELQVEKKKSTDVELLYLAEKAEREALEKKLQDIGDQLYSTCIENDAIKEKFSGMVADRDRRISQLVKEIERLKYHKQDERGFRTVELDDSHQSKSETDIDIKSEICKLKEKHEQEISALMSVNAANLEQMRMEYEGMIKELESWNVMDTHESSSTDDQNFSKMHKNMDSLKLENAEKTKQLSATHAEIEKKDQLIADLQIRMYELQASSTKIEENQKQLQQKEDELKSQADEIKRLKILNAELMSSYNEANSKMEEMKKVGTHSESVNNLSANISSMRSALNEAESRYEMCKMEQAETSGRLDNLLKEFADLRSTMQAAKITAENNEQELMGEVILLRDTVGKAKEDRETLIRDFRESMKSINEELAQLRECNRRLAEENSELGTSLTEFETLRNSLNSSNHELCTFREKFAQMQSEYMEEIQDLKEERDELKRKVDELNALQSDAVTSEADLTLREQMAQRIEILTGELSEKEEELQRMKTEKLFTANMPAEEFKMRPASDTDSASAASNNDWERMGKEDIEVEGVSSNTSETKESHAHEVEEKSLTLTIEENKINNDATTQSDEVQDDIHLMQMNEIDILRKENEELKTFVDKKHTEYEECCAKIQELKEENEQIRTLMQAKHSECQENYDRFQEVDNLNEKLKELVQKKDVECQEYSAKLQEFSALLKENDEMKAVIQEMDAKCQEYSAKLQELSTLQKENDEMKAVIQERDKERQEYSAKLQELSTLHEENELMKAHMRENHTEVQERLQEFTTLKQENEEMKALIQKKHAECQEYYAKLQEFATHSEQTEQRLKSVENNLVIREQEIGMKNERITKLESELTRLTDHLLTIEDLSSKEAEAAEERETELRRQIRFLQEKWNNDESSNTKTMESYQREMIESKERISILENESIQLRQRLEEKETALKDANKALKNLQIVLKDIAEDQRREKLQLETELREAKQELKTEKATLLKQMEELQGLEENKTNEHNQLVSLEEQLSAKNALIEELENQLEGIRIRDRDTQGTTAGTSSTRSSNSYKIDDSTLRQLFISFFTAEKSKQPDIAMIMVKILGYSAQEQAQIQSALNASTSGSWLFGLGGGANQNNRGGLSLTEQFIRFLEQESVTNTQPMLTLPIESESRSSFSVDEPISSLSPSTSDLKSILDQ